MSGIDDGAASGHWRVGVMGAGAVGGFFGARLAGAGVPVTLVARPVHVDAVRADGLVVDGPDGTLTYRVDAATEPEALRDADIVLVCVKSTDTRAAAASLRSVLQPDALVLSLQNGYDNAWAIAETVPNAVVPAAIYVSVEMAGAGRIRHNGGGTIVAGRPLGAAGDAAPARLAWIAGAFERAGVAWRTSDDIRVDLWTKLTTNCAYNAVSAITQRRYGPLAADAGAREIMRLVVDESAAIASAEGVPVTRATLETAVRTIAEVMPGALSSTAQDVRRGKRTEIDELNGFLVRRGQALGIATPTNRLLQTLVALLEPGAEPAR